MAGSVLTRDWEALQMADTIAQQGHITVTGEVELTDTGTTAELKEHTPPGTDPKVLLLDLVIHRHGAGQSHRSMVGSDQRHGLLRGADRRRRSASAGQ